MFKCCPSKVNLDFDSMAANDDLLVNTTNPYPLEQPVFLSNTTFADAMRPNSRKYFRSSWWPTLHGRFPTNNFWNRPLAAIIKLLKLIDNNNYASLSLFVCVCEEERVQWKLPLLWFWMKKIYFRLGTKKLWKIGIYPFEKCGAYQYLFAKISFYLFR